MRVGIIAFLHESNTFVCKPTTLAHFQQDTLQTGQAIRDRFADSQHEIGGFFAGLETERIEAVPIFVARAVPYGPITTAAFQGLIEMIHAEVAKAGSLDGILVAPHGATVCESIRDADGYWLARLRAQVGTKVPIIGTLDAHANLSQSMVDSTNALIAYRTNPHLDQRDRGIEAAVLLARTIRGEINPIQQAAFPPLAINIERQMTAEPPLAGLYDLADSIKHRPGILTNSILLGFPYADVEEMGSAVLVVADGDQNLADRCAQELADSMWQQRQKFDARLTSIDEALLRATSVDGPVCLLDMGDNVGGGSPGDGTHIAHAIGNYGLQDAFICICDPESVAQAESAGIGATIEMRIGGKTDSLHGRPYRSRCVVKGIYAGKFTESQTRHGGFTNFDQGRSAVVQSIDNCNLTFLLTSLRIPPFSLMQLSSCEIDPADFRLIVAKGVHAPVAAYAPVCKQLIRVNSPGCTSAQITQFDYVHRRRPMFPFDSVEDIFIL